jgi:hypothetical protein
MSWPAFIRPAAGAITAFAAVISYVPPSAFTNTTRDALLRAGLVTEATLRARQIY